MPITYFFIFLLYYWKVWFSFSLVNKKTTSNIYSFEHAFFGLKFSSQISFLEVVSWGKSLEQVILVVQIMERCLIKMCLIKGWGKVYQKRVIKKKVLTDKWRSLGHLAKYWYYLILYYTTRLYRNYSTWYKVFKFTVMINLNYLLHVILHDIQWLFDPHALTRSRVFHCKIFACVFWSWKTLSGDIYLDYNLFLQHRIIFLNSFGSKYYLLY